MSLIESAGAALVSSVSNVVTTASFTPAANTLLVAVAACGNGNNASTTTLAITDSLSATWTTLVLKTLASSSMGIIAVKDSGSSPAAQTVTATGVTSSVDGVLAIVRQFSNAAPAASQTGVVASSGVSSTEPYTQSITPLTTGSQVVGAYGQSTSGVSLVANASTSMPGTPSYGSFQNGANDTTAVFEASSLSTANSGITLGFTNSGTASGIFVLAEILPALVSFKAAQEIVRQAVRRSYFF